LTDQPREETQPADVSLQVTPGICGFTCVVRIHKIDKRTIRVAIDDSECKQIQRLAGMLDRLTLKELFTPLTRNPVYSAAEKSGCHASCVLPAAILKAAEVAMGMALARDVALKFEPLERGDR
jgi:hypothetical protein